MFRLLTIQENISDKEMPCDAVQGLFDYFKITEPSKKHKHIVTFSFKTLP